MALDAPLHLQRGVIEHQRHAINRAVTGIAADALIYMNAVVEINKVGQIVHPIPDQRLARPEALAHRLEQGRARPDMRVAVHARLSRRNSGKARSLDRSVKVKAINAERNYVMP